MVRILEEVSKLYIVHFISFAASILILWFLAQYRDSFPYNYAVLFIWAIALALTVASAGAMIIDHSEIESGIKLGNYKRKCPEDKQNDPDNLEAGLESSVFDRSARYDLGSVLILRRAREIIHAVLATTILSTVLVIAGLQFGSEIFQLEATSSLWRSTFLICWIYAGIVEGYPRSEKQHRSQYCLLLFKFPTSE